MTDENKSSGAASLEGQEPRQIELTFGEAEGSLAAGAGQSAADGQEGSLAAAAAPAAMTAEELMAAAAKAPEAVREAPQAASKEESPAGSAVREHVADAIRDTEVILSPEEQKMVDAFAEKIDITNGAAIMQYGAGTQKKMSEFG